MIELDIINDDSLEVTTVEDDEDAMVSLAIDEDVSVKEALIMLDKVIEEGVLETTLDSD
jgi:hypothetical protein